MMHRRGLGFFGGAVLGVWMPLGGATIAQASSEDDALGVLKQALIKSLSVEACLKKVEVQRKVTLTGPSAPTCVPPGDEKLVAALIAAEAQCAEPDYSKVVHSCDVKFPCVTETKTTPLANPLCNADKSYCVDSTFSKTQNCSLQKRCKSEIWPAVKAAYVPLALNGVWKIRNTPCSTTEKGTDNGNSTSDVPPSGRSGGPNRAGGGGSGRPAPTERVVCEVRGIMLPEKAPWSASGEGALLASEYGVDFAAHVFTCRYPVNGVLLQVSRSIPAWVTKCDPMSGLPKGSVGALCR